MTLDFLTPSPLISYGFELGKAASTSRFVTKGMFDTMPLDALDGAGVSCSDSPETCL